MYVYIARSIDKRDHKAAHRVSANVRQIETALSNEGHTVYRPDLAFRVPGTANDSAVYDVNTLSLNRADAVVAFVTGDSVGVPAEVQKAIDRGKYVALVVADALSEKSWHIYGWTKERNVKLWTCAFHFGEQTDDDRAVMAADISNWLSTRGKPSTFSETLAAKVKEMYGMVDGQPPPDSYPRGGQIGIYGGVPVFDPATNLARIGAGPQPVLKFVVDHDNYPDSVLPTKAYRGDAGWDLTINRDWHLAPGEFRDLSTGVYAELPEGTWGRICGRSSAIRLGLLVVEGVIDQGYRGELFVGVQNVSGQSRTILAGTKLAQLIVIPQAGERAEQVEQDELSDSDRGTNGFGSSGGTASE